MTMESAVNTITRIVRTHGFDVMEDESSFVRLKIRDETGIMNIMIHEEFVDADYEKHEATYKLTFSASIALISAYPTTVELRRTAKTIKRAADMVDALNAEELMFTWVR